MTDLSLPKFPPEGDSESTEDFGKDVQRIQQVAPPLDRTKVTPGSYSDSYTIRRILVESMRRCSKSRAQIADEISFLVGTEVTERRLQGFAAESREDLRWPAELARAFAYVTGDDRILRCQVELAGYTVISGAEVQLLELGRQYLQRKRSEAEMVEIERRLKESGL